MSDDHDPIRHRYESQGVDGYYRRHGSEYRNPHEEEVREALRGCLGRLDLTSVLDLGAGSGEMSLELLPLAKELLACDPYTGAAYRERVGRACEPWSFKDLAKGCLGDRRFSLIVACYVLHLCPESLLPTLCWELGQHSTQLLVLSPHKRPVLAPEWGWNLEWEDYQNRVRLRLYRRW